MNYPLQLQITAYRLVPTTDSSLAIPFFVVPDLVLLQSLFLCFKLCPLYLLKFCLKGDNGMSGQ